MLPEATVRNKDTCPMSRSQVQRDVGEWAVGIHVPSGEGWVSLRAGIDVSMQEILLRSDHEFQRA